MAGILGKYVTAVARSARGVRAEPQRRPERRDGARALQDVRREVDDGVDAGELLEELEDDADAQPPQDLRLEERAPAGLAPRRALRLLGRRLLEGGELGLAGPPRSVPSAARARSRRPLRSRYRGDSGSRSTRAA